MLHLVVSNTSRIAITAALILGAQVCYAADATPASSDSLKSAAVSTSIPDSARKFVQFCYQIDDAAQIKARLELCKPGLDNLKATTDVESSLSALAKDAADRARAATEAEKVQQWGRTWSYALVVTDAIAIVIAILVAIGVVRSPDPTSFVREPGVGAAPGKVSFGRLLGLVGGLASLAFVGLITNICLSYLFATGKLPDQLGPMYVTAIGTFFASLIPYLIGKLKS